MCLRGVKRGSRKSPFRLANTSRSRGQSISIMLFQNAQSQTHLSQDGCCFLSGNRMVFGDLFVFLHAAPNNINLFGFFPLFISCFLTGVCLSVNALCSSFCNSCHDLFLSVEVLQLDNKLFLLLNFVTSGEVSWVRAWDFCCVVGKQKEARGLEEETLHHRGSLSDYPCKVRKQNHVHFLGLHLYFCVYENVYCLELVTKSHMPAQVYSHVCEQTWRGWRRCFWVRVIYTEYSGPYH